MHWMSIITALILALASAFLVFIKDWEPWLAFLAVGCSAIGILLTMVSAILLLSTGNGRMEFWRGLHVTFRRDLEGFLEMLGIKKR
jgi:hypothetical protein